MKIKKKDLKVVLYLVGILALVAGYFLGYQNLAEKRTELEAQRTLLQEKETKVNEIYENQSTYQEEADEAEQKASEILAKYPADVQGEDVILYTVDLENEFDAQVTTIGFTEDNLLYTVGANTGDEAEDTSTDDTDDTDETDETDTADTTQSAAEVTSQDIGIVDASTVQLPQISMLETTVTYDFTIGYTDCKSMFQSILDYANKRNVSSISLSYDSESGQLAGNMIVNMFYLTGTDKEYTEPDSGVTLHGTDNIFATLEKGDKNDKKKEDESEQ
jgi:hypothetical protein